MPDDVGIREPVPDAEPAVPQVAPNSPPARAFPLAAQVPTQEGPLGIRYDFNGGCRVFLPEGNWRLKLTDLNADVILCDQLSSGGCISTNKRFFMRIRIEIWADNQAVFEHEYDAAGREVLMEFPVGTLGDTIAWFSYATKFQEVHGCRLVCAMSEQNSDILRDEYPHISFIPHEKVELDKYYASYMLGLFFNDVNGDFQPFEHRLVGLHNTVAYILGVEPTECPPRVSSQEGGRPIEEPYVCIAAQASTQCKFWNHPHGWRETVAFLKEHGYRVICIDKLPAHGVGIVWNQIPFGCEDQTGDRPLRERVRWLKHADFFVGLASGLSWLAWAVGTKVVMISGFSHPSTEFYTPYRVINRGACNSCWNDARYTFDHHNFLWCPRHAGTPRQFECTQLITPHMVKSAIRRIPGFGKHQRTALATETEPHPAMTTERLE